MIEAVAEALVAYGKDLYQAGKAYGRFSETINAVTAKRPSLRRRIPQAWDLAFNWVVDDLRAQCSAASVSHVSNRCPIPSLGLEQRSSCHCDDMDWSTEDWRKFGSLEGRSCTSPRLSAWQLVCTTFDKIS